MKAVRFLFVSFLCFYSSFAQAGLQFKIRSSNPEVDNLNSVQSKEIVELDNLAGAIYNGTTKLCDFPIEEGVYSCGGSEIQVITHSNRVDAILANDENMVQLSAEIPNRDKDVCWFERASAGAQVAFMDGKIKVRGVTISSRYGKHVAGLCGLENQTIANHQAVPQPFECGVISDGSKEDPINAKVFFVKRKLQEGYDLYLVGELFYKDGAKLCDITDWDSSNKDNDPKTTWIYGE